MKIVFTISIMFAMISCSGKPNNIVSDKKELMNRDTITLGAGCFWCVEAIFTELEGVESVAPGYAGGHVENPSYKEVCTGNTGHAEVAQVVYDPEVISLADILKIYWKTHDPTTLNRQGNDVGTQYRSVIFYHNKEQKELAEKFKKQLNDEGAWENPVITEIAPLDAFYEAEDYHHDYFSQNPDQQYCKFVIQPKVEKFKKVFPDKLKE